MKKIFTIGIVLVAAGILLLWVWNRFGSSSSPSRPQTQVQFPNGLSVSTSTVTAIPIATASGTIAVKNFLVDPGTKEDSANKGYYFLGNQPTASVSYIIEYQANTQYFNVSLLQEPIGRARTQAEAYLLEHLGLSKDQLCTLNYTLSTPDSVNSNYSDQNLGFSFCPGAVQLPN